VTAVLRAVSVRKSYRRGPEEVHAVDGITLELRAGELVALIGPSGSGKTTLLNLLIGWEEPDAGAIEWAPGLEAASDWQRAAVVPQRMGLLPELTIGENVELPLRLAEGPGAGRDRSAQVLAELGLDHLAGRLVDEASLGEQQRTALARALVADPHVLLADEPTGHQDEAWVAGVLSALRAHRERGMAALVASHDPEVREAADRVVTLRDGRIAEAW
jgi:putative ABC transport system ATP-binding protein